MELNSRRLHAGVLTVADLKSSCELLLKLKYGKIP